MVNNTDIPPEKLKDQAVAGGSQDEALISIRDGSRTPMQWDSTAQAGFSFGKDVEPWLPVHSNYPEVSVKKELADPYSILNFYRALLKTRKTSKALTFGTWRTLIYYPFEHLAYIRETTEEQVLVVINFSYEKPLVMNEPIAKEDWQVLLSNVWEIGKVLDLPDKLEPFEVTILTRSIE
jgi:alpha-glucosidase